MSDNNTLKDTNVTIQEIRNGPFIKGGNESDVNDVLDYLEKNYQLRDAEEAVSDCLKMFKIKKNSSSKIGTVYNGPKVKFGPRKEN